MNSSQQRRATTVLLAFAVVVLGFTIWPGCAFLPLPSKRQPISARTKDQFQFKKEHPTRAEVESRLGPPDVYVPDIRVAGYRVNDVTRRTLTFFLFVIPVNVERINKTEVAFIEYDSSNEERIRRAEIQQMYPRDQLGRAATNWWREQLPPEQRLNSRGR